MASVVPKALQSPGSMVGNRVLSIGASPAVVRPSIARQPLRSRIAPRVASVERPVVEPSSLDPVAGLWSTEDHVPGQVWTMHSPEQLQEALDTHKQQLCVLMCKSKACRPCKVFTKKYMSVAKRFPEAVMMQMFGDETPETRKLMVDMRVKVTPTFALYRGGIQMAMVTGISEPKLLRAMVDLMEPWELNGHEEDIAHLEDAEAAPVAPSRY